LPARPSFLSNAAQLHHVWPELFTLESKKLPYWHYNRIAVSRLELHQKNELRAVPCSYTRKSASMAGTAKAKKSKIKWRIAT